MLNGKGFENKYNNLDQWVMSKGVKIELSLKILITFCKSFLNANMFWTLFAHLEKFIEFLFV